MEIFNVHRRDILTFDDYMDLKKPGFGGPSSAKQLKDSKGNDIDTNRKLNDFQRVVKRDELFSHPVYDPTYKAMGGDLVHKQEVGKNPYNYPDTYNNMGIPVVNVGKAKVTNEGMCYDFISFVLESDADTTEKELCVECGDDEECKECEEKHTGSVASVSEAKKWIADAIKRKGDLRKKMNKKEGETIKVSEINKKLKSLDTDKSKPGVQAKGEKNKRTVRQLNLAKTLKNLKK